MIDYQRMAGLRLLDRRRHRLRREHAHRPPLDATPIQNVRTVACDTDSHTSVVLARIILAKSFRITPELVELDRAGHSGQPSTAILLIGDKVVCQEPRDLPYQLDLGEAWKQFTGLPFVFAAWMARGEIDINELPAKLRRAKIEGLAHVDAIIRQHAILARLACTGRPPLSHAASAIRHRPASPGDWLFHRYA